MYLDIYWLGSPELGFLSCEVTRHIKDGSNKTPTYAQYLRGKENKIVYSHSENHYVWVKKHYLNGVPK